MRNINNKIMKFVGIVTGISIKINKILVNSAIFIIKNNQIFEYFIFRTLFIMAGRVNFKSLNDGLIIIYIYNTQDKNCTIVKTVYAPLLMQVVAQQISLNSLVTSLSGQILR